MNNDLRECIEELQKYKKKMAAIQAKENKERTSLNEYIATERASFEEYAALERRNLEKRIASERDTLEEKVEDKIREFEEKIKPLSEEGTKVHDKINSLGKNVASIRLGDLIEELASLAGINATDIMMSTYSGIMIDEVHSTEEMYEMMKDRTTKENGDIWHLILYTNSFRYEMMLNADLNSKQADGKTFLEHCVAVPWGKKTCLYVNINRDDLIVNMPLSYLSIESDPSWCPADLMMQAVINCVDRNRENEVSKKRVRTLSVEAKK